MVGRNIDSQQLDSLAEILKKACKTSEMDFALIYDPEGRLQSSFPQSLEKKQAEEYFEFLELSTFMKAQESEKSKRVDVVTRQDRGFFEAFGLGDHDGLETGGIIMASALVIVDDFDDPIGLCIVGKLLNGYHEPFKQLHETMGFASAIYLDAIPIAHAGFNVKDVATLRINKDSLEKTYRAEKLTDSVVALAGERYVTSWSPLTSFKGEGIGAICAAVPEKQVIEAQRKLASYGLSTKHGVQSLLICIGLFSMVIFIVLSLLIARSISGPIEKVIKGMTEASDQVAAASGQMSGSSRSLAEGTSEQAASAEETSSSLEEMASMTKRNAENAGLANGIVLESKKDMTDADKSMNEITVSIQEISRASEETSKIIKTIDEIAFQTNLLALNAAVEAARAGEAGAGFAVVADEVRNLALRSAKAANSTTTLIEGTITRVNEGSRLVAEANEAFRKVSTGSIKLGEVVAEIAAASNEQAMGIDQVNQAIAALDKVIQQNASNAEESAGASQEMSLQADNMKKMVSQLAGMVEKGGMKKRKKVQTDASQAKTVAAGHSSVKRHEKKTVAMVEGDVQKVSPKDVIPLEEKDDFTDF